MSLRKLNIVAGTVRGLPLETAVAMLRFMPKKGAKVLYKVINSAAANAENTSKASRRNLIVSRIVVQKGTTLKRGIPVSRGRWHSIYKRTCHVEVQLTEREGATTPKTSAKAKGAAVQETPAKTAPAKTAKPEAAAKKRPSKKLAATS